MPFSGGDKLKQHLKNIRKNLGRGLVVQAGFPEDATYPNGLPVAYVASIQEYGGTVTIPEHEVTVYKKLNAAGTEYLRGGRFVKKSQANLETTHTVEAYTVTTPPRPFFRTTIASKKQDWAELAAKTLLANNYDMKITLGQVGEAMAGDITQTIRDWSEPPNAPSTVASKGFNKPLIDSGQIAQSVKSKVNEGSEGQ